VVAGSPAASADSPYATASPASVDFGTHPAGSLTTATVVVTANSTISIDGVAVGSAINYPGPFWIDRDGCSGRIYAAGDTCSFDVSFRPTSLGSYSDSVRVGYNGPGAAYQLLVPVSGVAATTPTAPGSAAAEPGPQPGQVTVSWAPPSSDGGSPVIGYQVYRAPAGGSFTLVGSATATATSYTDSGLPAGSIWQYYLTAVNAIGEGAASSSVNATTFSAPGAPQSVQATPGAQAGQIGLSWQQPTSDGGSPINAYDVYRAGSDGVFSLIATTAASAVSYTDSGLPAGSIWQYYLTASTTSVPGQRAAR